MVDVCCGFDVVLTFDTLCLQVSATICKIMPNPNKMQRISDERDSDSDSISSAESESDTYYGQKEIQATFEGRNLEDIDFHGIKQLLQQLFRKSHIDLSEMSDLLIGQHGIGSVLKQSFNDSDDDDEDIENLTEEQVVFGVTSVINLTSHKETPCVLQLYSLLNEITLKHADSATQEGIKRILNQSQRIGFLINERFVSIPPKISVIMLNSLHDEIERMKKKNASYNFEYYIMICKTCRPKENKDSEEIFSNAEEEIFSKEAEVNFEFKVADDSDNGQVEPYRRILFFKADKLKNIISQVTAFVQQ